MEHREYHSELFRSIYAKGAAEGSAEGEAKGEAKAILAFLSARRIPVSAAIRKRVLACTDVATLDVWVRRAAVAKTAAEVVEAIESPKRVARRPAKRTRKAARA